MMKWYCDRRGRGDARLRADQDQVPGPLRPDPLGQGRGEPPDSPRMGGRVHPPLWSRSRPSDQAAERRGSIFPYRNGYAAYAWVTTPDGERKRKWVYGKTHDEVHEKWIKLQTRARQGPMPTTTPTLASYLAYWLREVVEPNLAPKTTEKYALLTRLYLVPGLGGKRLDRLQVRDIRTWLNRLRTTCQCCAQGKDAARPAERRRCCAIGDCCQQVLSEPDHQGRAGRAAGRARQRRGRGAAAPQRRRYRTAARAQETAEAMVVGRGSPRLPGIRPARP